MSSCARRKQTRAIFRFIIGLMRGVKALAAMHQDFDGKPPTTALMDAEQ
jgi:hypothetical protein